MKIRCNYIFNSSPRVSGIRKSTAESLKRNDQQRVTSTATTMGPKQKPTKSCSDADMAGDDDALAVRLIELLNDDRVLRKLKTALYPQPLSDKIDRQNTLINQLLDQLKSSETKITTLEDRVKALEQHADRNEQYTRRSNLLFSGIPEAGQNEDTDQMILDVINKKMEMTPPLETVDIERSHRLGKKRDDRDRPIIVRFGSDRLRDQVIRSRSKLKTSADRRDAKPIYVNEDLTAYRAKLAFDARQLKKKGRVADTWTFNGKIVIKDKRNNISEIASADDLVRFQ